MSIVVGTAGHIDHGKTALLRALTGIDADRLPEEQRRGMTIDVGYAHAALPGGEEIDFVDVPGHDRLIGNMLVGAGEIDAAMLVVAADDGPRAQTLEHLELLDALGISHGIVVVTKVDLVEGDRRTTVIDEVRRLVAPTTLAAAPVVAASSVTGEGIDELREELAALRGRPAGSEGQSAGTRSARLAIDRAFAVRGRGLVVTGTLRHGSIARGDALRLEPGRRSVRVREVQVHGRTVASASAGRVALNLAGIDLDEVRRGMVLSAGPAVETTERFLAELRLRTPLRHGLRVRVHLGTDVVDGTLDLGRRAAAPLPGGRTTAILRLDQPIAAAFGDAFVVRRPSPGETLAGGRVLDPLPPRGVSRRRIDAGSLARLAATAPGSPEQRSALIALHGAMPVDRLAAWAAATGSEPPETNAATTAVIEPAIDDALRAAVGPAVPADGAPLADVRANLVADLRRLATVDRGRAVGIADRVIADAVDAGVVVRDGDRLRPAGSRSGPSPELAAAMGRLESALAVPSPPALADAARATGCSIDGIRALEAAGRIVRVEDDLAWEAVTFRRFEALAVRLAANGPLAPAAYRDATGTSRRFALAILEDLDRRAVLRRTPAGHVPGPRAGSIGAPA